MATAAKDVTDAAAVVLSLSPYDVLVGDRLGAFWPVKAAALGRLMAEDGQIVPIVVRKSGPRAAAPWTLVAGHHRLEGAKLEGLAFIYAIEMTGSQSDYLNSEAAENVERPSRSPIERACFVRAIADAAEARLKDRHDGLSQQQVAIRARWDGMKAKAPGVARDEDLNDAEADYTADILSGVYGWAEEVAEALGMTSRTVRRDLALHRALVAPFPTLYRALATHPTVGENASALREIAAIKDVANRRALIEALVEAPNLTLAAAGRSSPKENTQLADAPNLTLAAAMERLGLSQPASAPASGATRFMNGTTANLARLSAGDQAQIAPEIVKTMKPSALLALRAALDARIEQEGIGNA